MAINLHAGQSEVYEDLFYSQVCRFAVMCCSRGFGKSYLAATVAVTAIAELLQLRANIPNKTVYIIAPTYDQVTDIYYPLLNYDLGLEHWAIKSSRDLGRFVFPNNVELRLLSYEAVERMRGKGKMSAFVKLCEFGESPSGIIPSQAWKGTSLKV
jgi:hypothetical protein